MPEDYTPNRRQRVIHATSMLLIILFGIGACGFLLGCLVGILVAEINGMSNQQGADLFLYFGFATGGLAALTGGIVLFKKKYKEEKEYFRTHGEWPPSESEGANYTQFNNY